MSQAHAHVGLSLNNTCNNEQYTCNIPLGVTLLLVSLSPLHLLIRLRHPHAMFDKT